MVWFEVRGLFIMLKQTYFSSQSGAVVHAGYFVSVWVASLAFFARSVPSQSIPLGRMFWKAFESLVSHCTLDSAGYRNAPDSTDYFSLGVIIISNRPPANLPSDFSRGSNIGELSLETFLLISVIHIEGSTFHSISTWIVALSCGGLQLHKIDTA